MEGGGKWGFFALAVTAVYERVGKLLIKVKGGEIHGKLKLIF